MDDLEARDFIADAVGFGGGVWAELGAGTGTFTRALRSLLGPTGRIFAVDRDPAAVAALRSLGSAVTPVQADFTSDAVLPDVVESSLDGMLLANALHFAPDPGVVLARVVRLVRPGGRVVVVEYDRRQANPWVPYPIDAEVWVALARQVGLANARVTARRKSAYAGELYVAVAERARG